MKEINLNSEFVQIVIILLCLIVLIYGIYKISNKKRIKEEKEYDFIFDNNDKKFVKNEIKTKLGKGGLNEKEREYLNKKYNQISINDC